MSGPIPAPTNLKPNCVRCRYSENIDKRQGKLLKPCECNEDNKFYHYQCLCECIVEEMDAPCRGCSQEYRDPRIVRNPQKIWKFVTQCPKDHIYGSIPMAILLIIWFFYWLRQLSRSYEPLCSIHNYPQPGTIAAVGMSVAVLATLCIAYIIHKYKKWFQTLDRIILFYGWKDDPDIVRVFNVTEARRNCRVEKVPEK